MHKSKVKSLAVFLSLSTICAFVWYWKFHTLSLMQADSQSYISASSFRTIGYPLFLSAINYIFGALSIVPIVQLSLLVCSATYLATQFWDYSRSYFLTSLLMIGLMINPGYHYAFTIMTEAVSISLLMLFLGLTIRLFQLPTIRGMVWLSLVAGISILVRPAHYAYIPALMALGITIHACYRFRRYQCFGALLMPLLLMVFLGCAGQYWKNGIFRLETMGSSNMMGKVALIADHSVSSRHPQFLKEVADYSVPVRTYLEKTYTLSMRYILSGPYYDYFRYQYLPLIGKRIPVDDSSYNQTTVDIIKAYPLRYMQDVWMNWCALWQLYDLMTGQEQKRLCEFISDHPNPPFINYPWYPHTINFPFKNDPIFVRGIRLTLLGICLAGLWMLLGCFTRMIQRRTLSPLILMGGATALVTQSHFLLTAMAQAGLPRYSFAQWPAIVMVGIIALEMGRQRWKGNHS